MNHWKMALIVGIMLVVIAGTYGFAQGAGRKPYHQEYSFDFGGIEKIRVSEVDSQIHVIPGEGNEIRVDIAGSLGKSEYPIEAEIKGGQLVIERKTSISSFFVFNFGRRASVINVYVPQGYGKDIEISSVSGSVDIHPVKAKGLTIDTIAGEITLSGVACDTVKLSTVSGNISAQSLKTRESKVSSTSGRIELADFAGDFDGKNVSGKVAVAYARFDNNVRVDTVSGGIELTLTGAEDFKLETSSISGRVSNEFDAKTLGNGKNHIRLETVSGRMTVKR